MKPQNGQHLDCPLCVKIIKTALKLKFTSVCGWKQIQNNVVRRKISSLELILCPVFLLLRHSKEKDKTHANC